MNNPGTFGSREAEGGGGTTAAAGRAAVAGISPEAAFQPDAAASGADQELISTVQARSSVEGEEGPAIDIAVLASLSRSVKERPADAGTWRDATPGV